MYYYILYKKNVPNTMICTSKYFILGSLLHFLIVVNANMYSVIVGTEQHVNLVDSRFLSFTIDPKYLFSSSKQYNSQECICMASSLAPAFIRIAGPSTSHMTFQNTTISIKDLESPDIEHQSKRDQLETLSESRIDERKLAVSHIQWRKFVQWAKSTGFDLVFALNNEERMASGMWDPNTTLNILTVAEKAKIGEIFWQLGYECTNQSIEEYLNDLETLRVIVETFVPGRERVWRVVGGDVTHCLHAESKSDFKDYVTLSNNMMDALLLNGNSSSHELERMSESDRLKLLKLLSRSATPLWLTETTQRRYSEVERAADWLTSLGYSARNGFSVHYRELMAEEMHEPTLSFYMALLFKNLVGERVLNVEMDPDQAIMFAHCTSLRHKPVPGAVTLYGVNMDDEPAGFSLKLSKREEGGDIMQFILGHDISGNVVVNGRAMYHEGDLKPVVKRVRPYKTLLINLPPKSFGFWVLANTNIEACHDPEEDNTNDVQFIEAVPVSDEIDDNRVKNKRSVKLDTDLVDYAKMSDVSVDVFDDNDSSIFIESRRNTDALTNMIVNLNNDLGKVHKLFAEKLVNTDKKSRRRRQIDDEHLNEYKRQKLRRRGHKLRTDKNKKLNPELKHNSVIGNLLQITKRNITRNIRIDRPRKRSRFVKNKVNKRNSKVKSKNVPLTATENIEEKVRNRRNLNENDYEDLSIENDIDSTKDNVQLWKIMHRIHKQLQDLSTERQYDIREEDSINHDSDTDEVKKFTDGVKSDIENDTGFIKSTVENLLIVISDLNKNLNRFWNAVTLIE